MSASSLNDQVEGIIEGSIRLDTGKKEILSDLNRLENLLDQFSEEQSEENKQTYQLIEKSAEDVTKAIKELKKDLLNKLREEESMLTDLRKTTAQLDTKLDKQSGKQEEILQTAEQLQSEFIFEEKILPGTKKIIKARDNVIGQLGSADESEDNYIFLEAMDTALEETVEEFGVTEVVPEDGEKFDPNIQEVVKEEKTLESRQDKKILEVLRPGYRWEERLIRPQQVKVANFDGGAK